MKSSSHTLKLIYLAAALIMAASFLAILLTEEAGAERIGPQSTPAADEDWIINTTGNRIIDETVWMEVIDGDPPSMIKHDNSVEVNGNLIIMDGGELTLINASLTFIDDDEVGFHVDIQKGGTLTLTAQGAMWNRSSLTGETDNDMVPTGTPNKYIKVEGKLDMVQASSLQQFTEGITVDGGEANITGQSFDSEFTLLPTLTLKNARANVTNSSFYNALDDDELRLFSVEDSIVANFWGCGFYTNGSVPLWIKNSVLNGGETMFNGLSSPRSKGLYAEDSSVTLQGGLFKSIKDYAVKTTGTTDIILKDTTIKLINYNTPLEPNYAFDFRGNSTIIENSELKLKNTFPFIRVQGDGPFRFAGNEVYRFTGNSVLSETTGKVEVENNTFYEIDGTPVTIRDATDVKVNGNEFTYKRVWDRHLQDYVVQNIHQHALILEDVESFEIKDNLFQMTERSALVLRDSLDGRVINNTFNKVGHNATDTLHSILIDRSYAELKNNTFNDNILFGGYEIFVVGHGDDDPIYEIDGNATMENNTFNHTILNRFAQTWELVVRTVNPSSGTVKQAGVKVNDGENEEEYRTDNLGRIGPIPIYEYTLNGPNDTKLTTYHEYNITGNITAGNIAFITQDSIVPNKHHNIELVLNLLVVKWVTVADPPSGDVLNNFAVSLNFYLDNYAQSMVNQNLTFFYRNTEDTEWIEIETIRLAVLSGEKEYSYLWEDILPIGLYDIRMEMTDSVNSDPVEAGAQKLMALEVFSRPMVSIDFAQGTIIAGEDVAITGTALDPMEDVIKTIELFIKHEGQNSTKQTPDIRRGDTDWEWDFHMDTTQMLNGRYKIWVRAVNDASNWTFSRSKWKSVDLAVVNVPSLAISYTIPDLTIPGKEIVSEDYTGAVVIKGAFENLYKNTHILERIDVKIDDEIERQANMELMTPPFPSSWSFTWDDWQNFDDGPHDFEIVGYYNNTEKLVPMDPVEMTITINSPRESTNPMLTIDSNRPMDEDGNFLVSGNASDDWRLKTLQYRLGSGGAWTNLANLDTDTREKEWSIAIDYHELIIGANYIYVRAEDDFRKVEEFTIISFNPRYDLEVLEVNVVSEVEVGETFLATVKLRNNGPQDTPEDISIYLYIGNTPLEKTFKLDAEQSRTIEFQTKMGQAGSFNVRAVANPSLKEMEENSLNNEMAATGTLTVIDPLIPDVESEDTELLGDGTLIVVVLGVLLVVVAGLVAYYGNSLRTSKGPKAPTQSAYQPPVKRIDDPATGGDHTIDIAALENMVAQREMESESTTLPPPPPLSGKPEEAPSQKTEVPSLDQWHLQSTQGLEKSGEKEPPKIQR